MSVLYCYLGSFLPLSLLELNKLGIAVRNIGYSHLVALDDVPADKAQELLNNLGGTVKIMERIAAFSLATLGTDTEKNEDLVLNWMATAVREQLIKGQNRYQFSLTVSSDISDLAPDSTTLKKLLKKDEYDNKVSVRYIESPSNGLSAAILLHEKDVDDLFLIKDGEELVLVKTAAIQDIDEWTNRDRNKPYEDHKKGMLTPKIARMMVNFTGLRQFDAFNTDKSAIAKKIIYDPFCGTGTILMEAAQFGFKVLGSDIDQASVTGTKTNLNWLLNEDFDKVIRPGAVSDNIWPEYKGQIDAIVTEPFLGKPRPALPQLANIFKGLEKLYLGAFKQWRTLLKNDAIIVIILPKVQLDRTNFSLRAFVDKLSASGYTLLSEPVDYFRPEAIVRRQIFILKYNSTEHKNTN